MSDEKLYSLLDPRYVLAEQDIKDIQQLYEEN